MSTDDEALKRNYRQFLELLPVTLAIAGLPTSEGNRHYTSEQMQNRSQTVIAAYKVTRQLIREVVRGG